MSCTTDNLDLEACINLNRDKREPMLYAWQITGMTIAPSFTLTLLKRDRTIAKTYTIVPVIDVLNWTAPISDFTDGLMYYSIIPTIPTSSNWIEIKGEITSN